LLWEDKDLKRIHHRYIKAAKIFSKKKGSTLAASSSFYLILTIVPLSLLFIRLVGFALGDLTKSGEEILYLAGGLFPEAAPEILDQFKNLLSGPLLGGGKFTLINTFILLITGTSLFNSIWNGLYLMTEDRSHTSRWKYLQGIGIIALSIITLIFLIALPPVLMGLLTFLKTGFAAEFFADKLSTSNSFLIWLNQLNINSFNFLRSNSFIGLLILGYFTFLYRWFFRFKITWRESFFSAFTFVFFLLLAKNLFWIYLSNARSSLVSNYGDYYTFILGCTWIFLVMCLFFFGACLSFAFQKDPLEIGLPIEDEDNKGHNKQHD
jgi:membrane protein